MGHRITLPILVYIPETRLHRIMNLLFSNFHLENVTD
jgi:hypothetical protein